MNEVFERVRLILFVILVDVDNVCMCGMNWRVRLKLIFMSLVMMLLVVIKNI